MQLRVDELNEQGSINGRKLKLFVEDSGYDPKKAVLAAQKLVNQDKIFIMAGHIGTAQNMAAMPVQFEKNVVNFFPITAAREMYEPFNRLKYSFAATYYDQIRMALPKMVKDKGAKKVCTIYQDDEFGLEVQRGAEAGLKAVGMEFAEKTSLQARRHRLLVAGRASMKAAGCDLVVLGTIIRETIGTIGEARKTGFNPTFLGSSAAYTDLIHKLGGKPMDGIYATMTVQNPYLDEASQPIRFWANKYKTKFNEDPTVFSVYGYIDHRRVHPGRRQGRPQPHDRQLHQGDGLDDLRARHVRQRADELHADQAPGQRPVAPVADPGRPLEGRLRLHPARIDDRRAAPSRRQARPRTSCASRARRARSRSCSPSGSPSSATSRSGASSAALVSGPARGGRRRSARSSSSWRRSAPDAARPPGAAR